ncbi:MAG: NTP transferase domain-containing protein [SAR324 cluster bacterium]|nr:NTP transferase domain-containing protein [SAR324 cluster bacterium]
MEDRGAVIIAEGQPSGKAGRCDMTRFGELDLLARLVRELRPLVSRMVIIPLETPFPPDYQSKYLQGMELAEPRAASAHPARVMAAVLEAFPDPAAKVAVITSDLPYLTAAWVERMFDALEPQADGLCVCEGEQRLPLLAVYRPRLFKDARSSGEGAADGASELPATEKLAVLPAETLHNGSATVATRLDSPEAYRRALAHLGFCDASHPAVTLELYGNLRIRTGCGQLPLHGDSVATVCQVLQRVYPEAAKWLPATEQLTEHFRFAINGGEVVTALDHPLRENDHLIVFSATVGG